MVRSAIATHVHKQFTSKGRSFIDADCGDRNSNSLNKTFHLAGVREALRMDTGQVLNPVCNKEDPNCTRIVE